MDLESVSEGDGSEVPLNNQHLNRGGIKVFGLRSRLASDDFVLPAWIAFLTRVIYLTTTLAIMVYSMQIVKLGQEIIVSQLDWSSASYTNLLSKYSNDNCFGRRKISAACLLKTNYLLKISSKTKHCNLTRKLVCLLKCKVLFLTLFLEGNQKKLSNECISVIK